MLTTCVTWCARATAALGIGVLIAASAHAQELPSAPLSLAGGRVTVGTDMSFSTSSRNDKPAYFNYTDYEHSTMRLSRIGVSAEIHVTDRVSFLGEVRSENGDHIRPYALYVRVRPWKDRAMDIQAGRIPPTFGAFSRRTYAGGNLLIGYPLAYQYLTSLRPDAVPATADELLRMRARGWRPSYSIGSRAIGTGMPLVSAFRWDTGAEVRIGSDQLMVSAAVTNGTISDPHIDNDGGKQIAGRVQWQPRAGLILGASSAAGPYVADAVRKLAGGQGSSSQRAFGFDAEYSRDHWLVRTEGVWNRWQVPTLSTPLTATGRFVEGRYKVLPGLFVAARVDQLTFNRIAGTSQTRPWDAPVTRYEAGLGYYIQRNLLAKVTSQHNHRDGGLIRRGKQVAVQLQFWL
jgi:hypothetical protein